MGARGLLARLAGLPRAGWPAHEPAATVSLRRAVPRLSPGSPDRARAMYRGHCDLGGMTVTCPPLDLFATHLPPQAAAALHGLVWLRDFATEPRALTSVMARRLLAAWAETARSPDPAVEATALLNLTLDGPLLFAAATDDKLARLVASQAQRILGQRRHDVGLDLWQGVALAHAVTVFSGLDTLRDAMEARLSRGLAGFILPDGAPLSRQPAHLMELLSLLLPLRQAMFEARLPVPAALHGALERMLPMLRLLCHGDGGLALFQGAAPMAAEVAALLALDSTQGKPLGLAAHAGFARLAQGQALLVADTATGGPHHSALAIEFSDGPHRILSNCGSPRWGNADWHRAACSSLAHNTLSPGDDEVQASSSAAATLEHARAGSLLTMTAHHAQGVSHQRECFLSGNGQHLRVSDSLSQVPEGVTLRLHLHPTVKAQSFHQGEKFLLILPSRAVWEMEAAEVEMRLEDSVFMAGSEGPRRSQQIVLRPRASAGPVTIRWALRKQGKPARARSESQPELVTASD